ncbi:tryptophan 2-monooxygenase [Neofusicoccum parvum]|nr:tryptophan 2-monooxygenase [Neofusicoccum parvum]
MPLIPNLRTYANTTQRGIPKLIIRPGEAAPTNPFQGGAVQALPQEHLNTPIQAQAQGYLDTPEVIYSEWNKQAGGIDKPLGTLDKSFKVCLIGGGISNVVAAFELAKAGADVTLLEATDKVGGRLQSIATPDGRDVAEMGAMRFPPSEDLLYYYAEQTGFTFLPDFPDPGHKPTILSYQNKGSLWYDTKVPPGFEKVYNGWGEFIVNGITANGKTVLESSNKLQEWLQSDTSAGRRNVIPAWQAYLDEFANDSFYEGLQKIFGDKHRWDVPKGEVWTDEDFQRFGALGLGSGGFGPLFPIAFTTVFRLIPNGLETNQQIFAKQHVTGNATPAGIQDLAAEILEKAVNLGLKVKYNTVGNPVSLNGSPSNSKRAGQPVSAVKGMTVNVEETASDGPAVTNTYSFVIVGTTTHEMNVEMSVTSQPFFTSEVRDAINNVHMTASSKLFIRTKKFWEGKDPSFPRVILSDTKLPQLYTLDYGDPEYGMVLVTYAWEDLSTEIQVYTDPKKLFVNLKAQLTDIMRNTAYPDWVENLIPVTDNDYYLMHWQLNPHTNGAFVLGYPGQDNLTAQMFFDFTKLNTQALSPMLLNGDSISFTGGWVDGGLQCAMNNLSAILKTYGTLAPDAAALAPINVVRPQNYKY